MKNKPSFGCVSVRQKQGNSKPLKLPVTSCPPALLSLRFFFPAALASKRGGGRAKEGQSRILGASSPQLSLPIKFKMHHFLFVQKLFANFLVKDSLMCASPPPPRQKKLCRKPQGTRRCLLSSDINHRFIQLSQHELLMKPELTGFKHLITWCLCIDFLYGVPKSQFKNGC